MHIAGCEEVDQKGLNGGEILKYMGTPSVARDMVAMVDKVDELRKKESQNNDERNDKSAKEEGDVPRLQYVRVFVWHYFGELF